MTTLKVDSPKVTPKGSPKGTPNRTPGGTPRQRRKIIKPENFGTQLVEGVSALLGKCQGKRNVYEFRVKTRDFEGGGTDDDVFCAIIGEDDERSTDLLLDKLFRDDLERGKEDTFVFKDVPHIDINGLELWRVGNNRMRRNWFCEYILVQHTECDQEEPCTQKGEVLPFPCHRWINAEQKYHLYIYNSCLPQFDIIPARELNRMEEIQQKKAAYRFEQESTGFPRRVAKLPPNEQMAPGYFSDIQARKKTLFLEKKMQEWFQPHKWDTFEDMLNLYRKTFHIPKGWYNWKDDKKFGDQRLNGPNTTQLRRCDALPSKFPVKNEDVAPFLEGMSLDEAIKQQRIYIVDFDYLEGISTKDDQTLVTPLGLFYANKSGILMPIAIQLFQQPSHDNPIFFPSDPEYVWVLAKMYFNNADACVHQTCNHLGYTHFICESICGAANQALPSCHPVYQLLAPHFLYLLAINSTGLQVLMAEGGYFDVVLTIGVVGFRDLLVKRWKKWRFDKDGWLPLNIEERGVGNKDILKEFYSRDDSLQIHQAIVDYVTDVLTGVYDTPEKLKEDHEIQDFARILVDEKDGSGLKGVFGGGKFEHLEDLIKVVSATIFMASVGHASANFGQYDEYAFAPAYPGRLTGEVIKDKTERTEQDIIAKLPNKEDTLTTMLIMHLLSQRDTNNLGDFEIQFLYEPKAVQAVERFKDNLKRIGNEITTRNERLQASGSTCYPYLHPKEIPNAISI